MGMTFYEWFSQQKFDGDPLFLLEECWKAAQPNREAKLKEKNT
jgi:hypothetical protein